jgi:hypothetical protein
MNSRRVSSFVDSVLSDRRPKPFQGGSDDAHLIRAAIALRSARRGDGAPDEEFVAQLRHELALEVGGDTATPTRPVATRRARLMVGAAAMVTMLGGTVAATTTVDHALAAGTAAHGRPSQLLRTGTFTSTEGQRVGQIVAYDGDPAWVFMSINAPGMNGPVRCQLELSNGRTTATGTFEVHNGVGEWARPVSVDLGNIRRATLMTPAGSALATASIHVI